MRNYQISLKAFSAHSLEMALNGRGCERRDYTHSASGEEISPFRMLVSSVNSLSRRMRYVTGNENTGLSRSSCRKAEDERQPPTIHYDQRDAVFNEL